MAQNQFFDQLTYSRMHTICIRKLISAHSKVYHCGLTMCQLGWISL